MKSCIVSVLLFVLSIAPTVATAQGTDVTAQPEAGTPTGICDITAHGIEFDGKRVLVSGAIVGPIEHGFAVVDVEKRCKSRLVLNFEDTADYEALLRAVKNAGGRANGHSITASFTGVFHNNLKARHRKWTLQVDQISNIEVNVQAIGQALSH